MLRLALLATAVTVSPLESDPQAHPLVGVWNISYAAGVRMVNGEASVVTANGTLTIEARGDSLIAVLAPTAAPGQPRRPDVRLATKAGSPEVVFVQHSTAKINENGMERDVASTSTWRLAAKGDELEGTVARKIEGMDAPMGGGPQPVHGKRARS